jgi:hypothetical protein
LRWKRIIAGGPLCRPLSSPWRPSCDPIDACGLTP